MFLLFLFCLQDDEWSPYIAFPLNNTKEIFLSHPMKCKPCDQMRRKNNCCEYESSLNGPCSVIKKHLLLKLNSSISENLETKDNNNGQKTEKPCLDKISALNENLQSVNTADLWDKLKKCCKTKSRTPWQRSLANDFFLESLKVEKKSTSCEDRNRVVSIWNLQRCECKGLRETKTNEESLDEMIESDEDCDSPCLCPKYFISKSGLVFGSLEEVG